MVLVGIFIVPDYRNRLGGAKQCMAICRLRRVSFATDLLQNQTIQVSRALRGYALRGSVQVMGRE
jgi:hypothetical protein